MRDVVFQVVEEYIDTIERPRGKHGGLIALAAVVHAGVTAANDERTADGYIS